MKIIIQITDISDTPVGELLEVRERGFLGDKLVIEGLTGMIVRSKQKSTNKQSDTPDQMMELFRLLIQTTDGQQLMFAEASGDYNFIHTNMLLARLAGLPRTIMHDACVMAMGCNALVTHVLKNDTSRLTGISGRFGKPTLPGDQLVLIGYESHEPNEILFELRNKSDQLVFKKGNFSYK
ncbi:hypothetical protein JW960_23260 [candidate division KSB1 bacterium]|nr:hypothetical protein [candidate division KSB1 bacterium]